MCLIAFQFQPNHAHPLLLAANREEFFDRPALPPHKQAGSPAVMCGIDERAGGTWLGVNQFGVLVAVTDRRKKEVPLAPRSRGLLCRELLNCPTALVAHELAMAELSQNSYAGCNFLLADLLTAHIIHAGDQLETNTLSAGFYAVANGNINDEQDARLNRVRQSHISHISTAAQFISQAQQMCAWGSGPTGEAAIVLRKDARGTVSSSIITLARLPSQSSYYHSAGPPDVTPYEDYSPTMRTILSSDA